MKILGYDYEEYIEIRKELLLSNEQCRIKDYIYIVDFDRLYLISKDDISMLEIEKYSYIGKMLGLDVYTKPMIGEVK